MPESFIRTLIIRVMLDRSEECAVNRGKDVIGHKSKSADHPLTQYQKPPTSKEMQRERKDPFFLHT
jgi:hypothetical protein